MLFVCLVAYFEQETRKTDIIFELIHGNVTDYSSAYIGECEFLWLEIGISLIKKFYVFDSTNEGAICIVPFVEQSLFGTISFCFFNWFRFRLKLHVVSLESRNIKIKAVNIFEMIFRIDCDEIE